MYSRLGLYFYAYRDDKRIVRCGRCIGPPVRSHTRCQRTEYVQCAPVRASCSSSWKVWINWLGNMQGHAAELHTVPQLPPSHESGWTEPKWSSSNLENSLKSTAQELLFIFYVLFRSRVGRSAQLHAIDRVAGTEDVVGSSVERGSLAGDAGAGWLHRSVHRQWLRLARALRQLERGRPGRDWCPLWTAQKAHLCRVFCTQERGNGSLQEE